MRRVLLLTPLLLGCTRLYGEFPGTKEVHPDAGGADCGQCTPLDGGAPDLYLGPSSWETITSLPLARESGAAVAGPDGRIYFLGGVRFGTGTATVLDEVEAYDPATKKWASVAPMLVPRRRLSAATGADGRIYALGGSSKYSSYEPIADAEAYDPTTKRWSPVRAMSRVRGDFAAAAMADGRIYVTGGFAPDEHSFIEPSSAAESYDPLSNQWSPEGNLRIARAGHAAVVVNGRLYAGGGMNSEETELSSVEVYDPNSRLWSQVTTMPIPRAHLAATSYGDNRIYFLGGYHNGYPAQVDVYDPMTDQWSSASDLPTPRAYLAAVYLDRIYVIAGASAREYAVSTVEAYGPKTEQ